MKWSRKESKTVECSSMINNILIALIVVVFCVMGLKLKKSNDELTKSLAAIGIEKNNYEKYKHFPVEPTEDGKEVVVIGGKYNGLRGIISKRDSRLMYQFESNNDRVVIKMIGDENYDSGIWMKRENVYFVQPIPKIREN